VLPHQLRRCHLRKPHQRSHRRIHLPCPRHNLSELRICHSRSDICKHLIAARNGNPSQERKEQKYYLWVRDSSHRRRKLQIRGCLSPCGRNRPHQSCHLRCFSRSRVSPGFLSRRHQELPHPCLGRP